MLHELAKLFTGKTGDRRAHPRKVQQYPLWWRKDESTAIQGRGLEISPNGAVFVLREKPPEGDFTVIGQFGERRVALRVSPQRVNPITQAGQQWYHFATKFTGISADDWDFIVRYVNDVGEQANKGAEEAKAAMSKDDDAYRLLPLVLQQRIVETLVQMKKLDAVQQGQIPLLKMTYGGVTKKGEKPIHVFHVHSRAKLDDEFVAFDTTFLIDAEGNITVQRVRP